MRRAPLIAVCLCAMVLFGAAPASRAEVTLFAAWHAAYGEPHATDTLSAVCNDRGGDTLYVSFDPGDTVATFYGLYATVAFRAGGQDSLSDRWKFGGGEGNDYNVRVQSGPDDSLGTLQPWGSTALGGVRYDYTHQVGFLRMVYAQSSAAPTRLVPGKRYCFARLIFPHPPDFPICRTPACIELESVKLTTGLGDDNHELLGTRGEHRLVSFNSPNGAVCSPEARGAHRPPTWTPWNR